MKKAYHLKMSERVSGERDVPGAKSRRKTLVSWHVVNLIKIS